MAQKQSYFRIVFARTNILKRAFLTAILNICSYPRLVIEVFIRRNFGERYFNLASALTVFVALFCIPFLTANMAVATGFDVILYNPVWYLFTAAYLYCSIQRYKEIRRNPSVFDFGKFSLSSGQSLPLFDTLLIRGKRIDDRTLETIVEPLPFFIIGFLLLVMGQYNIGLLLMFCAFVYGVSYMAAYYLSDEAIMDVIDNMIVNQQARNFYTNGTSGQGVTFRSKRPSNPSVANKIVNSLFTDPDDDEEPSLAS